MSSVPENHNSNDTSAHLGDHDHVGDKDNLGALLDDIEAASKVPSKRRQTSIKPTIENLTSVLYDRGALPDELARLVDLVTLTNHLDQASKGAIIKNLYPVGKLNTDSALKVVGALGHGQLKPSFPIQSLLLRWLIMVYPLLQDTSILSQTYGVLFNLLDTAAIRPQLCHVLALITRRKHVKPFRIQTILALSRQTGNDPNLTGLLRVFKNYYPEIIVGDAAKGRAATFKHPDPQWRARLDEIQQQQTEAIQDGTVRNGFAVKSAFGRQQRGAKGFFIPAVHTLHAQENSVTLEEISSPKSLADNLEKIELPTQLVAVLADPLLQKLMLLRPDAEGLSRVYNWVTACLDDVRSGDADPSLLLDMVDIIHDYVVSTKTLPPLLENFFREIFQIWNGKDKREIVIETLSFLPLTNFKDLSQTLLQPFESVLLDNTPESQLSLLTFYTSLLRQWTLTMLSSESTTLSSSAAPQSIPALIAHVNTLSLTLTQTSPTVPTHLLILDFYTLVSTRIFSSPSLLKHIPITIPPSLLIYTLHFSHSLEVVSRLCGILATYKRAWESVMVSTSPSARPLFAEERQQITTFNAFLMDLCNVLWRGRAFAVSDANAKGCLVPRALEAALRGYLKKVEPDGELVLGSVFGLSHSPVLCLQSISFLRELEDRELEGEMDISDRGLRARHAGPVTQQSLVALAGKGGLEISWQEYRAGVLRYLDERGFKGVPELMYNTMKNLMKGRQ
ncbi:Mis6-domain-containing protein [Copromyces sp. CBS 386.78]|nr:Mis6-domain-containing protein [Copromyces sp. CBS 386.78]